MDDRCCRHFGECGGCAHQDVPYPAQVEQKQRALEALLGEYWHGPVPVEASPVVWHYRNKVDLVIGCKFYDEPPPKEFQREAVLGFKAKGRWFKPLEIHECRIGPEDTAPLFAAVREWIRQENLPPFDTRVKRGFLKALLVRCGVRTGERMVVLITAEGDFNRASFVEAVRKAWNPTTIQRGIYRGFAEVAQADEVETLYGPATIDEELHVPQGRPLRFRLSPFSFFQTNTLATEQLYGALRDWVAQLSPPMVYDLYGGAGGIAFSCSDLVDHIDSVESVLSASDDGRHNAAVNGIVNVQFHTDKVEDYLRKVRDAGTFNSDATAIVDPPRAGMHPKALRRLMELRPAHLLYVSCKPSVLAAELPTLLETYRLVETRAVDLFPHTDHVELLARFERRV